MDTRIQILGLCGAVILGLSRVLDKKTPIGPNLSANLRLLLASVLSLASGVVDLMTNQNATLSAAAVATFIAGGPAFLDLLVTYLAHFISGSSDQEPPAAGKPVVGEFKGSKSEMPPPGPYSTKLMAWALAFGLLLPGCGAGTQMVLGELVTDAGDAAQILDVAAAIADIFFLSHPSPDAEAKVHKAIVAARLGLDMALKLSKGAQNLSRDEEDAAFGEFRSAYADLVTLFKQVGIVDGSGRRTATLGGPFLTLPEPIVVARVKR